jgi:hypothetical protein
MKIAEFGGQLNFTKVHFVPLPLGFFVTMLNKFFDETL